MPKFDAEQLLDELFSIVKANLNTKITKIQTEKAALLGSANFEVPTVDDNCWFDSLDDRIANCNPFVYYGINDNSVIEIASAESSDLTVFFTVVLDYDGEDVAMYRKMLRYIRALQEIASENFDEISEASNLKVVTINPQDLRNIEQDDDPHNLPNFHKIAGIAIQTAIA